VRNVNLHPLWQSECKYSRRQSVLERN